MVAPRLIIKQTAMFFFDGEGSCKGGSGTGEGAEKTEKPAETVEGETKETKEGDM